ncbi:hypothetical protein Tco_0260882 [Tanacetum coccineum]
MDQENYVKGCSMQRSPLLEADGFCLWKIRFETYFKSKDIDLWQVIQYSDFYFEIEDSETKMMKETPAKVTAIKEAKYFAILPLDELIGNLKIYEMILTSDGVASKPIKEKVMPIAFIANVTRGQTSNDSVCQDGSDEDKQEEFNSIVKNLWKLFKNGNRFERENHFGNGGDRFNRGHGNRSKGVGSSRGKRNCCGCGSKTYFVDDCPKAKMQKAFVGGAWSDSEDGDQMQKDATFLMAIGSQKVNLNPS